MFANEPSRWCKKHGFTNFIGELIRFGVELESEWWESCLLTGECPPIADAETQRWLERRRIA